MFSLHPASISYRAGLSFAFQSLKRPVSLPLPRVALGSRPRLLRLLKPHRACVAAVHNRVEPSSVSQSRTTFFTVPNIITSCRIACTPVIGYMMLTGHQRMAFCGFVLAGISDFADGWIAKKFNQQSLLGSYLDPFADKFLIGTMALTLVSMEALPMWSVVFVVGRDVLLICGTAVVRYRSLISRNISLQNYFDVASYPTHEVRPSLLGKLNTAAQLLWISAGITSITFDFPEPQLVQLMAYGVVGSTLASGFDYLSNRRDFLRNLIRRRRKNR
uniref:CDP-diacylglycerol--glycerol-3-phosphate 3-phosphatidyltransferase n=1 Tax=Spongospora subterranea TaxID=70186 RepID=A0A0H5R8A0_9EUKA|eukprot:CRZ09932.1 hypothetical protein [Spongospora subterranea]